MALERGTSSLIARVCLGVLAATVAVAFATWLVLAAQARSWLGFTFPGVPATLDEAGSIFLSNLRIMIVVFAAAFIANGPWIAPERRRRRRLTRGLGDLIVGFVLAQNVVLVGAAVGAYGGRMIGALLPHGPVELLAFSAALALHLQARKGPMPVRRVALLAGGAVVALAAAAVTEALA